MQLFRTEKEVLDAMIVSLRKSIETIDRGKTLDEREYERAALVGTVKYYLSQLGFFHDKPDGEVKQ